MSDDVCGHPTADGGECANPATEGDSCWIDAHGGSTSVGRDSKFSDERARDVIHAAKQGKSKAGCARAAGIGEATLARWLEADHTFVDADGQQRDFRSALRRARADGETVLIQGGLRDENVDSSMAKFLLATSFDYQKTERHEVEADVAHSGRIDGEHTLGEKERAALREAFGSRRDT